MAKCGDKATHKQETGRKAGSTEKLMSSQVLMSPLRSPFAMYAAIWIVIILALS